MITFSIEMFYRCIFRDITYVNFGSFKKITDLIPHTQYPSRHCTHRPMTYAWLTCRLGLYPQFVVVSC